MAVPGGIRILMAAIGTSMTFAEAQAVAEALDFDAKTTGETLRKFPRSPMGLVSDEVKNSPQYRAAKLTFDRAFNKLREFNAFYTKKFAKELQEARQARRR